MGYNFSYNTEEEIKDDWINDLPGLVKLVSSEGEHSYSISNACSPNDHILLPSLRDFLCALFKLRLCLGQLWNLTMRLLIFLSVTETYV